MDIKQGLLGIGCSVLLCSGTLAGDMGPMAPQGLRPVVSLQGGYASLNAGGNEQRFTGTDLDVFTYSNTSNKENTGFIGVFLGLEHAMPFIFYPGLFIQPGVEYNYFGKVDIDGINTVGIEPQTATGYRYHYNFQTQQVLGTLKLFATAYERFYPYGEVGLGGAFNHAKNYYATTTETGSINLTPGFSNHHTTQFSYSLGLGVDAQVCTKIRAGLGYRYSNFGSSSLGNGAVIFNNYQAAVPFALGNSNTYANQLLARISYVA